MDLKKGFDKTLENIPTVSEQVRSFPCQQCGHMYYSELNSIGTLKISSRRNEDGIVNIVGTNFVKKETSCSMKNIVRY